MGRPVDKWDREYILSINKLMDDYIETSAIPILAEFAYKNGLNRTQLYKYPELSDAIKKMMLKKEAQLEKLALSGSAPVPMCIFSLKQLGWRDNQNLQHTTIDENGKEKGLEIVVKRASDN